VDPEVDRGLDDAPHRARTRPVAGRGRQPALRGPAAVAVEDDRDGAGDLREVGLDQRLDAGQRPEA
jgi:hypothetical protein